MKTTELQLTQKRIFLFWIPLAAMWLFMSSEQPGINAVIARMADCKIKPRGIWDNPVNFTDYRKSNNPDAFGSHRSH